MRPKTWPELALLTTVLTTCLLVGKSFASFEDGHNVANLRRSVRDVASFSSSPLPTSTIVNVPSPSSASETPCSPLWRLLSSPPPPSLQTSSLSSTAVPWFPPLTSLPPPSSVTYPSPSSMAPSFPSSTTPSSFPRSSFSPPSSLTPLSPTSSPTLKTGSSSPSTTSSSLSPSLPYLTSQSPFLSSSFLLIPTSLSSPQSSEPPLSLSLLPTSSPLSTQNIPSNLTYTALQLLPFSFQLMSSSFHLLSWSFQLISSYLQILLSTSRLSFLLSHSAPSPSSGNSSFDFTLPLEPFSSSSHTPISSPSQSLSTPSPLTPSLSSESPTSSSFFWSNDSLVGLELECDAPAKACLSIGRLLDEETGQCFPLGDSRPCGGNGTLVLDADALCSGRLIPVCRTNDPCIGAVMAYDGKCHNFSDIRNALCNRSAKLKPHPTGLYECVCLENECLFGKVVVQQPSVAGKCYVPDFNLPPMLPFRIPCSDNCLSLNLYFQGECYRPLSNASCPQGEWLVLDEQAANLTAICAPKEPCGPDAQKLNADGRCHSKDEIRDILCPGEDLYPLPNGNMQCSNTSLFMFGRKEDDACEVKVNYDELFVIETSIGGPSLNCGANNNGECPPEVVPPEADPNVSPED